MPHRPIESFDPILRDLASYGLVARDEEEPGRWSLSDAAQRRLTELMDHRPVTFLPEKLVYLDHLCGGCHTRALTRLRDGLFLCDPCAAARSAMAADVEEPAAAG